MMPYYHVAITKKTGQDRTAFAFNMSREKLEKEIIAPLKQQKVFLCYNAMIYPTDIETIVISETEEPALKVLKRTRLARVTKKLFSTEKAHAEHIDDWTIIEAGKDVTRSLIGGLYISEETLKPERLVQKPEVSKDELKNYLNEFLRLYRLEAKKRYPAYFNDFPFYSAVRAIGVISPNYVYIIFTRDENPKASTTDVFGENDMPELLRVKDGINMRRQDIFRLLEIKTYIPDQVHKFWQERATGLRAPFLEPCISEAVDESIKNHHVNFVETEKDPNQVVSGSYAPSVIPKYSFVYNTVDETSLTDKIREIIDKTEEGEVLIAGWVDSVGVRLLGTLRKRHIKFRLITHRPSTSEKGQSPSDTFEVFGKLVEEYSESVRVLPKLHTRLLISDTEALVSAADLTKDSLETKYEAGISTTDGVTIMKMKDFFEELWKAGTKLKTTKAKA
jgi:hypothetical protein